MMQQHLRTDPAVENPIQELQINTMNVMDILHKESDFIKMRNIVQLEENIRKLMDSQNTRVQEVINTLTQTLNTAENYSHMKTLMEEHEEKMRILKREMDDLNFSVNNYEGRLSEVETEIQDAMQKFEALRQEEQEIQHNIENWIERDKNLNLLYNFVAPVEWDMSSGGKICSLTSTKDSTCVCLNFEEMDQESIHEFLFDQLNDHAVHI
ncbi:hypothetical protein C9374_003023 [Naegleria lovaniensis]|uniref:Kinetochore protein Spc24 n=1 Tax=Naegleria lovaniensis TaxID=51637 RepID=A0AA88GTJ2_NAELO|nr:uncharacterized protein C9374_003023 [Naegleria lovaniensis]KAG2385874.1 hypothetical protein C9374_003023 [Naegleria lovaniensis]